VEVAAAIVSLLLAALLTYSAIRKLGHRPAVVATYTRVGVPQDKLDILAYILLAGAAGLALGLLWAPVGIAAAAGIVTYFALAIASHIRADDIVSLPTPLTVELLAIAALTLQLAAL
jgi:DoxX-like family